MASEGSEAKSYSTDPALYIYTSLTAGSSHIVTATSRLETILRANRVPFKALDIATDEKARMLWGRRAGKDPSGRQRKIPGLVQMGMVLGDLVEIEEWNEYGELKQHVTMYYDEFTQPSISQAPKQAPPAAPKAPPAPAPKTTVERVAAVSEAAAKATLPVRTIAEEVAAKAKQVHLQSLRDKVHGKNASSNPSSPTSPSASTTPTTKTAASSPSSAIGAGAAAGLQSPTSSGWKAPSGTASIQSPTTTGWKPQDVDPPVRELRGAPVAPASAAEIAAVERAETIREVPGREGGEEKEDDDNSEEDEEDEDDDDEEEEDDEDDDEDEEEEDDDEEEEEEEDSDEEEAGTKAGGKAAEVKKAEDVKTTAEVKKVADVKKKTRDVKRAGEIKKAKEAEKAKEVKKAKEAKKAREAKKAEDEKKAKAAKKAKETKKSGEAKKAGTAKKTAGK